MTRYDSRDGADGGRRRADEREALGFETLAEAGVLGEEAVAGVHRGRARQPARLDDPVDVQVREPRRCGADGDALVCEAQVQSVSIGLGEHRDRGDAEPPRGPDDAAGDLAAVGYQDLVEHRATGVVVPASRRPD